MKVQTWKLFAITSAIAFATSAAAMPSNIEEMRQIIATDFRGDANAYVEQERKDFRRMACRERNDLIQALIEDGLQLDRLSYRTHIEAAQCAYNKEAGQTLRLILTPDLMTAWEEQLFGQKYSMSLT